MFSKNPDVLKNVQEDVLKNIFNACVNVVKSLPKNGIFSLIKYVSLINDLFTAGSNWK